MLETYLERGFPELFKSRTLMLFKDIKKSQDKDKYLVFFIDKLVFGRGERKTFLYEHLHVFEELFFSLYSKEIKERYAPMLLEKYFSHLEHHPKKYRQKIEEVQKALGKKLSDLPQFSDEKKFSELDKKTIFSFLKSLLPKKN